MNDNLYIHYQWIEIRSGDQSIIFYIISFSKLYSMLLSEKNQFLRESFRLNAVLLLKCNDNFALMKSAVDELYRVASYITDVRVDQCGESKEIVQPSWKVDDMKTSGFYLLEMKRIAVFLRGIYKAVNAKLSEVTSRPVRILYAGSGPYGELLTPLLHLYKANEVLVDFIEINPVLLLSLQKLIDGLELRQYVDEFYCADVTIFTVSKSYDIVISETMLACIKRESQVAVMQNLIPQLSKDCIFIPEEISINASLITPWIQMESLSYYQNEQALLERYPLGNVFKLGKLTIQNLSEHKVVEIPDEIARFPLLKLFTTVKVYRDEVLIDNDSGITLPKQYYDFREKAAREVEFWYTGGENPQIESRIVENNK